MNSKNGKITSLRLCVGGRAPMQEVSSANLITGQGIVLLIALLEALLDDCAALLGLLGLA